MSFSNPANRITRWSVAGMEGMWAKMFDPPTTSPATTDQVSLAPHQVSDGKGGTSLIRPNPVPEIMFAAGYFEKVRVPHTFQFDLMHGLKVDTWDGRREMLFFYSTSWPCHCNCL